MIPIEGIVSCNLAMETLVANEEACDFLHLRVNCNKVALKFFS